MTASIASIPCIFCQTMSLTCRGFTDDQGRFYKVQCDNCGAEGPSRPSRSRAIQDYVSRCKDQGSGLEGDLTERIKEAIWNAVVCLPSNGESRYRRIIRLEDTDEWVHLRFPELDEVAKNFVSELRGENEKVDEEEEEEDRDDD